MSDIAIRVEDRSSSSDSRTFSSSGSSTIASINPESFLVNIAGLPVRGKSVIAGSDPGLRACTTLEDWSRAARELRGQFAITASTGATTFAVTDPFGSYPVYYRLDPQSGQYAIAHRYESVAPGANHVSEEGLFRWTLRGTTDTVSLIDGVQKLPPGTVAQFINGVQRQIRYFDWLDPVNHSSCTETRSFDDLKEQFFDIACSYLVAILNYSGPPACLLSGGVDSALTAAVVQRIIGEPPPCFTTDYSIRRYSEFEQARANAKVLKAKLHRVAIRWSDHRRAFQDLNSGTQDSCHVSGQSSSLLCLAHSAEKAGLQVMLTGDHADATFLGFAGLFSGFPKRFEDYENMIAAASGTQKTEWLLRIFAVSAKPTVWDEMIVSSLGYDLGHYREWRVGAARREQDEIAQLARWGDLPELQQILGQTGAGSAWQNLYLGIEQAPDSVRVASIFYDIEMIRFAISLRHDMKYRDGMSKYFLREVLACETGIRLSGKRASPNPMRTWMFWPWYLFRMVNPALRSALSRLAIENIRRAGGLYHEVLKLSGLSLWLQAHDVASSSEFRMEWSGQPACQNL